MSSKPSVRAWQPCIWHQEWDFFGIYALRSWVIVLWMVLMVESRMLWIEEDKENHAVVWRVVEQAGSISGLAVHAHEPKLCHGDSLCCLDCNKCKAAGAWAQSLGLADTRLPLLLLHNKVKGSRRNVWERERCLHAVRALSKWTPALVPSTEVNLWEHNNENKMPARDGLHFWAAAAFVTDHGNVITGIRWVWSTLSKQSSWYRRTKCKTIILQGHDKQWFSEVNWTLQWGFLSSGIQLWCSHELQGCPSPGRASSWEETWVPLSRWLFFCSGSRGTQPGFSSLCMFLPILSTDACLGITWGTGEQGMLWAPAMPPQLLWDRQECFLFFPCRKSPVVNSHDRSQSRNIWFNLVLCPHYSSAGRWVVIC